MKRSSIKLEWKVRAGGGGQTERRFLEFVVDDVSLQGLLKTTNITPLGWFDRPWQEQAIERLLGEAADLPNDRRSLYVCAECGDLGCGAVSVVIERVGDDIIWKEFGFENIYSADVDFETFDGVGPFVFEATAYERTIRSALDIRNEQ